MIEKILMFMKCDHAEVIWNKTLISAQGSEAARQYWVNAP